MQRPAKPFTPVRFRLQPPRNMEQDFLNILGRKNHLFSSDIKSCTREIDEIVKSSSFLVIGAGGSIGQSVSKQIFLRNPKKLHCLDINENSLVELVRDLRSSTGYIEGDFKTYVIDIGSQYYESLLIDQGPYDYVLNLSALKHVRNEKDVYSLMRMIETNIIFTQSSLNKAIKHKTKKYFSVSTDKATNPENLMGASKRIMEMCLSSSGNEIDISSARFANVAFSDGSLLHGFTERIRKNQPIAAPNDIQRYFITPQESGELCLLSTLFGKSIDIFFPKFNPDLHLQKFSSLAVRYLDYLGYEPYLCNSEDEARSKIKDTQAKKIWPCYFSKTNTTGEKDCEEFFSESDKVNLSIYESIGIIEQSEFEQNASKVQEFIHAYNSLKESKNYIKEDIIEIFKICLPELNHEEKEKNLDQKM